MGLPTCLSKPSSIDVIIGCCFFIPLYFWQWNYLLDMTQPYINGEKTSKGLTEGWIPGRLQDLSDVQWRQWRRNLPLLCLFLFSFVILSNLFNLLLNKWMAQQQQQRLQDSEEMEEGFDESFKKNRVRYKMLFHFWASFGMIVFMHRSNFIKVYGFMAINYWIGRYFGKSRWNLPITWLFNLTLLFSSHYYSGYPQFIYFANLPLFGPYLSWLDSKGILSWETYFKLVILRMISANCDYYWMLQNIPLSDRLKSQIRHAHEKGELQFHANWQPKQEELGIGISFKDEEKEYNLRAEVHQPMSDYNLLYYYSYCLYIPLYIAGPIITYNAFVSQIKSKFLDMTLQVKVGLFVRLLFSTLLLEVALHYIYTHSWTLSGEWKEFSSLEVAFTGYYVVIFMSVKFMIIWRFFRIFAFFDHIYCLDNMGRCVNNHFTFTGFWRSWHRSLNLWTIRYMYVPLGGRKTQRFTIWLIFLFIGLWHDLWWRWITWALTNCLFFSLEIIILISASKWEFMTKSATMGIVWKWIVRAAASCNIFLLILAQMSLLHGFEDTPLFISKIFLSSDGLLIFMSGFFFFLSGIPLMQDIREREQSKDDGKRF